MNIHNINRQNLDDLLRRINSVLGQGQSSLGEVILALAEYSGRTIVAAADTPVSGFQLAGVFEDHLKRTLQAGYTAKGYNMGPIELNG